MVGTTYFIQPLNFGLAFTEIDITPAGAAAQAAASTEGAAILSPRMRRYSVVDTGVVDPNYGEVFQCFDHDPDYGSASANAPRGQRFGVATSQPAPTVTSVTPNTGPAAGGTAVTIKGKGFLSATAVTFGVTDSGGFAVVDDETIHVPSTPAVLAATVDVTVTNPTGTSATSAADHYTYT